MEVLKFLPGWRLLKFLLKLGPFLLGPIYLKERKVPKDKNSVISPSDSLITQIGKIEKSVSYQIKGMEYSIKELLGENYIDEVQKLDGGDYINLIFISKRLP